MLDKQPMENGEIHAASLYNQVHLSPCSQKAFNIQSIPFSSLFVAAKPASRMKRSKTPGFDLDAGKLCYHSVALKPISCFAPLFSLKDSVEQLNQCEEVLKKKKSKVCTDSRITFSYLLSS